MQAFVCAYVCTLMYIHVYKCIYMYLCIDACTSVYLHAHTYIYVCTCIYIYICISMYMYLFSYLCTSRIGDFHETCDSEYSVFLFSRLVHIQIRGWVFVVYESVEGALGPII